MSDEQFRLLFENSLDAMVLADDHGRYLDVNQAACDLFGYSRKQMLAMSVGDLMTLQSPEAAERYQAYLQSGREVGEFPFRRAGGEARIASYSACRLDQGQHLSMLRDITQARRAEQKLRDTEQERAHVLSSARCQLWYADITDSDHPDQLFWDAHFVDVEAAQRFLPLNMQPGELYQDARRRARLPEDRETSDRAGTASIRAGRSYEQEFRCYAADGTIHWLHEDIRVETVVEGRQWTAVGVCTDITARKQAEQALQQSEARFRSLIENALDIISIMDAEGIIRYQSPALEQVLGYTPDELTGKSAFGFVHPDDLPTLVAAFLRILSNPGVTVATEYRFRHTDGSWRLLESRGRNAFDNPAVSGVIINSRDITERAQYLQEIESLNSRLRRSIQETHHRVKNNLQIISALAELQTEEGEDTVPATAMKRIGQHTRSLAAIHDLLTHETKTDAHADSISIKAALDKLMPLLQVTTGGRRIQRVVEDFRLPVREGASLALLVSELVSNAVKHGHNEIEVSLTVKRDSACLQVSDDGPGFPPNFDWRKAANTGLGLIDSTGRHDLRGSISYQNRPEGGARVVVNFPIPQQAG